MKHIQRAGGVPEAHAGAFLLRYSLGGDDRNKQACIAPFQTDDPPGAAWCEPSSLTCSIWAVDAPCMSGLVRVQGQVARAESEVCKFCSSAIQLPSSAVHRMELLATLVRARSTLGVREATLAFAAARGRSAAGAVITCAAAGNASRSNPSPGAPAPAAPTAYVSGLYVRTTPRLGLCAGGSCAQGRTERCP